MFRIQMFPAREGDCLIVTYGDPAAPKRILVDAGRKATYRDLRPILAALPPEERVFELFVVTHVDRDHIEGALDLLSDPEPPITFRDIWFNGFHHLHQGDFENFGAVQGEQLSRVLKEGQNSGAFLWNGSFGPNGGHAACLPADGTLLDIDLGDGMVLTLLSPSQPKLRDLVDVWEEKCRGAGLVAGAQSVAPDPEHDGFETFGPIDIEALAERRFRGDDDRSEENGSSIALLMSYDGKRALLAGDAHADLLQESIERLILHLNDGEGPIQLDAFKLPHHGSRKNLSKELLQAVRCQNFLVSTNGSYFDHPDNVAMSRLIKYGRSGQHIWFNYASEETRRWDVADWKAEYGYQTHYPADDSNGTQTIDL